MTSLGWLAGLALAAVAAWALFVAVLALARPRGIDVAEARRLLPDIARLIRGLATDSSMPAGARWRLGLLAAYLALPFDLVPDVVPLVGLLDDVIVVAVALRLVVRRAGAASLERHWSGTPAGLALVRRLVGVAP